MVRLALWRIKLTGSPTRNVEADEEARQSSRGVNHMSSSSDFECTVCLRMLYKPTTLHCGHSFCCRCVAESFSHRQACPTCRVELPPESFPPKVALALAAAIEQLHPTETAERAVEEAATPLVAPGGIASLPLFFLEPLLPGQEIQLHVFEPRYIALTKRALSDAVLDGVFGMVEYGRAHSVTASFGVTCKILEHRELPGGPAGRRYFLRAVGVRRFRVSRSWLVDGYSNAQVVWAADASCGDQLVTALSRAAQLHEEVQEWIRRVEDGGWERTPRQLAKILEVLGPCPYLHGSVPGGAAGDIAVADPIYEHFGLWAAALINPLPPLGVAPEIRTAALTSTNSIERLYAVSEALGQSLEQVRRTRVRPRKLLVLVVVATFTGAFLDWYFDLGFRLGISPSPRQDWESMAALPFDAATGVGLLDEIDAVRALAE